MRNVTRRATALAVASVAALVPLGLTPAAHASDQVLTAEACPEGYRGVVVGYNHPKFGDKSVFLCTNI